MRRVSRHACEDGPLLEEQETEGQRQLHNLLLQQLHTDVDIDRCVAKKQCFAPSALYRPFGEQAAGVRSLSQFQALRDGEEELASLRELGLTDAEIQLWQSRDAPERAEKSHGVSIAPGVKQQRLQVIRDKIKARAELLSRPQRFASSRPLSRREMEIEQALFQGNERLGFLTALYHRDEDKQDGQQGETSSDTMDSLYRDILSKENQQAPTQDFQKETTEGSTQMKQSDQSQDSGQDNNQQKEAPDQQTELQSNTSYFSRQPEWRSVTSEEQQAPEKLAAPTQIDIKQPIGSLCGAGTGRSERPLTVRGEIETISDQEILNNRESEEGIKSIPRFRNYQAGKPSKVFLNRFNGPEVLVSSSTRYFRIFEVGKYEPADFGWSSRCWQKDMLAMLRCEVVPKQSILLTEVLCVKNLSAQASVAQLVALFSRFEQENGLPVIYRLLTGRMKGQAFITLPDVETAEKALHLVHGYRLHGKPLVVEFGRERQEEGKTEGAGSAGGE